ncbi:ATP-binding cassette domain-containing protein, partial [Blautia faecis]
MGLLDVKNLSFKYDNQIEKVFDNVSFQIDTNWKLGLIGRNGKGKTTLLELL